MLLTRVNAVTPKGVEKNVSIWVENGTIRRICAGPIPPTWPREVPLDGQGLYALPALIDLHVHGFGGYGPETGNPQDLLALSDALLEQGVGAFCPTLYAAAPEKMTALLEKLAPVIGQEKGAKIIGFHVEGPFISPLKPGVMRPQDIAAPDLETFKRIYAAAQGKLAAVTLAPELPGIKPIVDFCLQKHILVQAGHTNATYAQLQEAKTWGLTHVTHFGNAMRSFHHREPGSVGSVLLDEDFSCEVIADGVHVVPTVVQFLARVKALGKVVLVTDALRPTGKKNPPFVANNEEVFLEDHIWKRKTDHVIAGSSLTMLQGVRNLVAWDIPLETAVLWAATNPAQLIRLPGFGQLTQGACTPILLVDKNLKMCQMIR